MHTVTVYIAYCSYLMNIRYITYYTIDTHAAFMISACAVDIHDLNLKSLKFTKIVLKFSQK